MRTKNLLNGKPESGFRGLSAVLPAFCFAFAVFAAGGMVLAGCDNLTEGGRYDEAASPEITAPGVSGGPAFAAGYAKKTIKVNFEVKNGGWGLIRSQGIISTQDDSYGASDYALFANDFTITIIVPAWERYLNIRWKATDTRRKDTYLKSGLQLSEDGNGGIYNYNIVLDYNGRGKVATKNLSDVTVNTEDVNNNFSSALKRAAGIKVKFEVKNGGNGLSQSYGIVSTVSKDKFLSLWNDADFANSVWNACPFANDFSITIGGVPPDTKWLTIIWAGVEVTREPFTCIKGSLELNGSLDYTVTLDFNGKNKVATKNLQSVELVNSWDWNKVFERLFY